MLYRQLLSMRNPYIVNHVVSACVLKHWFQKTFLPTILIMLIIIAASFVYMVQQPSLAVGSQTVNKRLTLEQLANLNPPFRSCSFDPRSPQYSVSARYVIESTAGSANLTNNLIGQRDMNITIINNMTGSMTGKLLLNQSAPTQTITGQLLIKPAPQLGSFDIKHVSTECIGYYSKSFGSVPTNPDLSRVLHSNPPFGECGMRTANSTTYTIASIINQTQILRNVSSQTEMKIIIISDFINGGLSGKLLIGNNQPISLNIKAIETICKGSAL
jgi:hypothetical protein